jgi:diguanylate cyclase (GGDEF)-like protein
MEESGISDHANNLPLPFFSQCLGHAMGDLLLKEAVGRLKRAVRPNDGRRALRRRRVRHSRVHVADPDAAGALAARIRKSLAQPFVIENNRVRVTSSIGIALFSPEASGPETMMMQADLALYGAKDEGRNCYRFHSPDLDQAGARTRACGRRAHGRAGAGVISNSITSRRSSSPRAASPGWRP